MADIQSKSLLYFKGFLFLMLGAAAAGLLLAERPSFKVAGLLALSIWAFARTYYFAFYVIEHYIDSEFKFSGLGSLVSYLLRRGRRVSREPSADQSITKKSAAMPHPPAAEPSADRPAHAFQKKEFQGGQPGPNLLIVGGVHGDEFEAIAAMHRLIRRFQPLQQQRELKGSLTLVPVVNESAYWRGDRTGEDQLDLARTCPGREEGVETERVAFALSELIRSADFFIDLHSGGTTMAVVPMTGYVLHANADVREQQRRMASAFNLPIVWGASANLEGRSLSVARDANTPAIYAEFMGSGLCDSAGVAAYEEGCLNVMAMLGMLERELPVSRVQHVVEDPRPGAGHMQVCNPSPVSGFFTPNVNLGDEIQAGDLLGVVADLLGEQQTPALADQSGLVLVLRTFSRVLQGDCLGVILES